MEALLKPAGATLKDMCVLIAYVRDPGDQAVVWERIREQFGDIPMDVIVAPVCRPEWLVEVEGIGNYIGISSRTAAVLKIGWN